GVGLRPPLAPDLLPGGHGREEARLLFVRAELDDRRPEKEDAVLVHPAGGTGPVVLLLEDQPLDEVGALASVLDRPRHRRPPSGVELSLTCPVLIEALGVVLGVVRRVRDVLLRPTTGA